MNTPPAGEVAVPPECELCPKRSFGLGISCLECTELGCTECEFANDLKRPNEDDDEFYWEEHGACWR